MNDFGIVTAPDTVRIERLLPGPIERVWAYLTESEKRGTWLARGDMDLRPGGAMELVFHNNRLTDNDVAPPAKYEKYGGELRSHGHVVECDPPRLLVFTWDEEAGGDSQVRMELAPKGDQVQLIVTHSRLASREGMVSVSGGWHTHLGILADRLAGRTPEGFWKTLAPISAEYEKRIPA
ncbi:ATPase [Lysobacter soli]|uniref:SRPBCC family protein n=1 Tax=Lysobacter soli TaxID=453783 RepID=UPI0012ED413B|nr:SRPBCC family protein [Lysobacter soli]QGW65251.1 ATPase [Lysobacter soli]